MNNSDGVFPQFVSVSDLQRDYPGLLNKLKTTKRPLLVLKKNNLEAVILLPDVYQNLLEKVKEYEEQEALVAIQTYEKEKKQKKLKKMKSVKELFGK